MLSEKQHLLEIELKSRLIRALRHDSSWGRPFGEFVDLVRKNRLTAFLFGGTVRDLLLIGATCPPRDLDVVVDDAAFEFFLNDFPADTMQKNRFGGLKCKFRAVEIDVWPVKRTWAFKQGYGDEATFRALPSTAFFNLDAIVAEIAPVRLKPRAVFEAGFFEGILEHRIDCNLELTEHPELNAIRGFVLAQRTGFHFSNRLCRFLIDLFVAGKHAAFESIQLQHYKQLKISQDILVKNLEQMRAVLNKNPQSTFLPWFPQPIQDEFSFGPEPLCFELAS